MAQQKKPQSIDPVQVTETAWFYAERKGMAVVQECRDAHGTLLGTAQVIIPWATIRAATPPK